MSEVLRSTLEDIERTDRLEFSNKHIYLAGPGRGKTKAIFDLARIRYLIFVDFGKTSHTHFGCTLLVMCVRASLLCVRVFNNFRRFKATGHFRNVGEYQ